MIDESVKALILMGRPVSTHGIRINNYKYDYIVDVIGLDNYYSTINICTLEPKDVLPKEVFRHEEFKEITMFDLCLLNDMISELYIKLFNMFTDYEWIFDKTMCEFITSYDKERFTVSKGNMDTVITIIKEMYCVNKEKKESDREDIDDDMRELLMEFEEEERKVRRSKSNPITLNSIIEAISVKHPSINLLNIGSYTMYQLMHTYYRLEQIENYSKITSAIYAGTISGKDIDVNKIHWANEISL